MAEVAVPAGPHPVAVRTVRTVRTVEAYVVARAGAVVRPVGHHGGVAT